MKPCAQGIRTRGSLEQEKHTRGIWDEGGDIQSKGGWAENGKGRGPRTTLLDPKQSQRLPKPSPRLHLTEHLKVLFKMIPLMSVPFSHNSLILSFLN